MVTDQITNRLQIGIDAFLTDDQFVTIAIAHAILLMPVDNDKDKTEILESQMSGTIGQAKSIRLSASSSTTSAETTSNAGLKKKSSSGSVHGRRDSLRTRWFFDSSDDKMFVRKYGKTKETSVILFDGEPGEVSGLEPSKSQSDTLKVRLKIPLPVQSIGQVLLLGLFRNMLWRCCEKASGL